VVQSALLNGSIAIVVGGGRLRSSCERLRKVYVLVAVNKVLSQSSQRYICGFLWL